MRLLLITYDECGASISTPLSSMKEISQVRASHYRVLRNPQRTKLIRI